MVTLLCQLDQVDVIVLSDHRMTKVNKGNTVSLDIYIDTSRARVYYGNLALVYPEQGNVNSVLVLSNVHA